MLKGPHNSYPGTVEAVPNPGDALSTLRMAAGKRPVDHQRQLSGSDPSRPSRYTTTTQRSSFAEVNWVGIARESLTQLIALGSDTLLGVSRIRNVEVPDGSRDEVRIMKLPVGSGATESDSSKTIARIRLEDLAKPREDGVVQSWETVTIGRNYSAQEIFDSRVSRKHLSVTVSDTGTVDIDDLSTFGTSVLEADDMYPQHGQLGDAGQAALNTVADTLRSKPYLWEASYADQRVIDPQI